MLPSGNKAFIIIIIIIIIIIMFCVRHSGAGDVFHTKKQQNDVIGLGDVRCEDSSISLNTCDWSPSRLCHENFIVGVTCHENRGLHRVRLSQYYAIRECIVRKLFFVVGINRSKYFYLSNKDAQLNGSLGQKIVTTSTAAL